jgi:hypothetical protein
MDFNLFAEGIKKPFYAVHNAIFINQSAKMLMQLHYDPVPGAYIGCMPLDGQNSWAEG